jgi:SAM-dependent methyltransferase
VTPDSQTFRPDASRTFLDYELAQAVASLPFSTGKCLNLGCGTTGRYRELLAGFDVDGVDIADPQAQSMPWRYHRCDASQLPFSDAEFDFALAVESFEHIENNTADMQEVARTLKPGGWLVVTTPTHWTWPFELGRHGPHYYSLPELESLIQEAGLDVRLQRACGGALFWLSNFIKSWLSPLGQRLLGRRWWPVIDTALLPAYGLSKLTDRFLPFPPTNWLVVAQKSGG